MALPQIIAPPGTPCFLAANHGAQPGSQFADVPMRTGHARRRRVRTAAPRVVDVSWLLEAEQMLQVHTWFENALLVGSLPFAAQVANTDGTDLRWWTAEWVAPYQPVPMHLGRWLVTGQLRLTGLPQIDGPEASTAQIEFGLPLRGLARATFSGAAELELGLPLIGGSPTGVELGLPLTGVA